ncbi:cytochrome P450 94B3-like protein [Cinnamomum micranthum f. kanehirae]|uniref:Cytochrome P450 94B3-like protein n=1 Tax=Cinnamomum micranthum f. kanehirae TaxID=337451 RepID=A0A3S4NA56_9MAGN|nr:cytochrome P450 94B3-like protein [Cinnamomum micranthum f. kanehirae]
MAISLAFLLLSSSFLFLFLFIHHLLGIIRQRRHENSGHGPPTYPFIGCLISFYKNRHRLLDWYTDLLAKSQTQTIVVHRLGARRTIITANPDNVEYILKTKFHNFPKGKPFTEILGDLLGRGIFNVDGELWHTQRKLASHEFTAKSLRTFLVNTLEIEVKERLLPILESACANSNELDLQDLLRSFAFDIICKVSLGIDPGCLDPSLPASRLAKAFDVASEISARRGMSPVFGVWKAKRALRIGSEKRLREAVELVHSSVMEIIRSKKLKRAEESKDGEGVEGKDLLSRLILGGHDEEVIRDMVISFIIAGRDTTSAALTWLFWLLSHHPDIEREVFDEVSTASSPEERQLDYETLKNMKVLQACLCESMRLYPPVAWDSKHAIEGDVLPDGTQIKKGDRVTYFPYGMGRMETVWGEDCMKFKPHRWLVSHESVSPYKFPVFQGGPRICLGKEMAFIQMKFVVAAIMRRFELRPVSRDQPVFVPLLTAHMDGGFKAMVRERHMKCHVP